MAKAAAIIIAIWFIFTWPFWLKGLIPAPLDFLIGFYAPWQAGQLPIKNPAIPDVVSQIIPWKVFTIDIFKSGQIPLWNPYNFSGTPHAANWQSAVFYPLQFIFWLADFPTAWSIFILVQPLLAGLFTYLFVRRLKVSPFGSLLSALSFSFGGFMTTWLEWGTLGHALLWLPAALWAVETSKPKTTILFLSLSLLAGHLQVSLYVIILTAVYFYFRHRRPLSTLLIGILPFFLTAFQFFPSLELYFNSFRSQIAATDWFQAFRIPFFSLISFLAPDFFGHPVTRNSFTDHSYVEMTGYIGLIPLLLASVTLLAKPKSSPLKFFWWTIAIALALSLKTPLANLLTWLRLPVFSSSSPARIVALISFSSSVLAGFGLDQAATHFKSLKRALLGFSLIFALLWLSTWVFSLDVSRRNLILPSILFMAFVLIILLMRHAQYVTLAALVLLISAADLFRFHHKFTPYTSKNYWYPQLGFISFLKQQQGVNRNFGIFDAQLNLPFEVYSTDGYDTLFPAGYGKLLSLNTAGRVSNATISKNSHQTMPLLNLLGVKYVIQGVVHGAAPWELQLWNYPDQFINIYEDERYQVFLNKTAQPRAYLVNGGMANIKTYTPQKIIIEVDSSQSNTLVLSDNYYPGWQAALDSQPTSISRTPTNFRQIAIPAGSHTLTMNYRPLTFTAGLWLSAASLLVLLGINLFVKLKP